jgi:DnaJ-class molecular chaperone
MQVGFMEAFTGGKRRVQYKDPSTGKQNTLTVKIPAGVKNGQKLRLKGKGMPGEHGGQPGDLYIAVHIDEHPRFKRNDNDDLLVMEEIPFTTAALGGKIEVQGVDRSLTVTVPPGTKDSTILRLRNQGFTKLRSSERGNLLIEINIQVPMTLTKEQEELLKKLQGTGL